MTHPNRRRFLRSTVATVSAASFAPWMDLTPLRADEFEVAKTTTPTDTVEQLVRRIGNTPRNLCPDLIATELKAGTPYRELLAAAFLFAARRVGHHTVYLVQAAHQITLDVEPSSRLLPLFWAVDVMKEHLPRFGKTAVTQPIKGPLPLAAQAADDFDAALKSWDLDKADAAIVALSRAVGPKLAYEKLWHIAPRDWRFIGHIPIGIACGPKTLNTIGWQHAEETLRYQVHHLFEWSAADTKNQPFEANVERTNASAERLAFDWAAARSDEAAVKELHQLLRQGKWQPVCDWIDEALGANRVTAQTVWDAIHLTTAEFMFRMKLGGRRLSNRALHSNTATNALHYAFRRTSDTKQRHLTLLQAAAWAADFVKVEQGRGVLRDIDITAMELPEITGSEADTVDEIFASLPARAFQKEITDRSGQDRAGKLTLALMQQSPLNGEWFQTARRLLCQKTTINAHDFKFPIAMFEDLLHVSPAWRPHMLAGTVHYLHGPNSPDNEAVARGRELLAS